LHGYFNIIFLFTFVLCSVFNEPTGALRVQVKKLRNTNGHVLISLFRNGEGYPDKPEKAYRKGKADIVNGNALLVFSELPPGTYEVALLHDENDDLKMNKNWLGLPSEGYGFSNNVMGMFGPPDVSRASFNIMAGTQKVIDIKTRY
jgi:uncharacterized protein (DUF2141 family)